MSTLHRAGWAILALSSAACGDDAADSSAGGAGAGSTTSSGAGASGAGTSTGAGEGGGSTLEPGAAAPGWERAFAEGSAGVACSMSLAEVEAAGAPSITFGETTIAVGFEQVSGNNQDPVVVRFDAGTQTYCRYHETGGPDGRANGFTWDGGAAAYVVYTVVGGGSGIEAATTNGWLASYGNGGGPKVSVLARLDTATGELDAGTFVIAKKQDGKTNTHGPAAAPTKLAGGGVEFLGESAFQPMNPDRSIMVCTDYPFSTRYRFDDTLSSLSCSSSTNCTSKNPCE